MAGLDFNTSPPTILTNSSMNAGGGSASMANAFGNLLFYTDGFTIWNQNHLPMANGTGLSGANNVQPALIVKQPGNSNIYFVFTNNPSLKYSVVDMSLAAGMGSVTSLNNSVWTNYCTGQLVAAKHCNGIDVWVVIHEPNNSNFRSFLVTSAGVNPVPANSVALYQCCIYSAAKISQNGKKITVSDNSAIYLCDFDNSTGLVSNPLSLGQFIASEFSPDGTKLYGTKSFGLCQWDLCAGSNTAIAASAYTISASFASNGIQLAPDGKIYVARLNQTSLGVINNPNASGAGCNYNNTGQSIAPKVCQTGLPGFVSGFAIQPPPLSPFTHTVSLNFGCQSAGFTPPPIVQNFTIIGCSASGYSLTNFLWNFGDPASGSANTSTVTNPTHAYTALGTYTTQLILNYSCGGGSDTIRQPVIISQPCISVSSTSITCANLGSATVQALSGAGPYSYTWMPTAQTSSVATGLSPGTYTINVFDFGNNLTYSATTVFTSLVPLTGTVSNTSNLNCYGALTGTAAVTNLSGGSGSQNYFWTNGITTSSLSNLSNLGVGTWSVTVSDVLTGCTVNNTFTISQAPLITLTASASSPSTCALAGVVLTGTAIGGTPIPLSGYTYSWTGGPSTVGFSPVESVPGIYTYTLSATDQNNCKVTTTSSIQVVGNPTLSFSNPLICPLQTGTITATGASSYVWNGLYTGATFTDNPLITTTYTLSGSTAGCTSSAVVYIILKAVPMPTLTTNGPLCAGSAFIMNGTGGASYVWTGPSGFTSALQNPTIQATGLNNAGTYSLTVTSVNGCTASASSNLQVNPIPTLTAAGSTVCTGQTLTLSASSTPGVAYLWSGPPAFSSIQQVVYLVNASLTQAGNYTVKVTSVSGCTATAQAFVSVVPPPDPTLTLSSGSICAQSYNGSGNNMLATASGALSYTFTTPPYILATSPFSTSSLLTSISPYTPGPVTVTLTGSNGVCSVSKARTFTIVPNPIVTVSPASTVICYGQAFTYTAQGANSYTWSPTSAFITTYGTASVAIVSAAASTQFSVYGTSLGCNSAAQNISLAVNPLPVILLSQPTNTVCVNNSVALSVGGTGSTYSWSPHTGLNTTSGATVIANPANQQVYTIVSSLNSCTSTAMVTVFVLPLPNATFSLSKPALCLNDTVTLQGFGGEFYNWAIPLGFTRNGQSLTFPVDNAGYAGNYTLTVSDKAGCKKTSVFNLPVYDLPRGNFYGTQLKGCAPFCSDFNFSAPGYIASWRVNGQQFNGNTFSSCFTEPGNYLLLGDIYDPATSCKNVQSFTVNAWASPVADFVYFPEKPVENTDEVVFTNQSAGTQLIRWNWHFIDNEGYRTNNQNTSYLFTDKGIYPVAMIVTDSRGCSDSIIKSITVEADFNVYVPGAFTPNGDGLNELFKPVIRGAGNFSFTIFNRWGQKLFETSDPDGGWNGSFKGELCKPDVYIWKLDLSAENNASFKTGKQQHNLTGQVTLYR